MNIMIKLIITIIIMMMIIIMIMIIMIIVTHESMRGDWVGPSWGQQTHVGLVLDLARSSSRILQCTVIDLSVCQSVCLSVCLSVLPV